MNISAPYPLEYLMQSKYSHSEPASDSCHASIFDELVEPFVFSVRLIPDDPWE